MAVTQAELAGREPARSVEVDDVRALEHVREVASVRARVHPDAAADRPGDRAGELEAAETGCARAV